MWIFLSDVAALMSLLKEIRKNGLNPTPEWTSNLLNQIRGELAMLSEAVTAKFDEIKASIEAEKTEVTNAIDELKAKIEAGVPQEEVLAALDGLKGSVEGIYQTPVEPPVEPTP